MPGPAPRPRSGAIIIKDGHLLAIRRWNRERGEYFIIPGGGIEEGEAPEETAARELREEAGVTITNLRPYSQDTDPTYHGTQYFFLADISGGQEPTWQEPEKQTADDSYAFVWLEIGRLKEIRLLPLSLRDALAVTERP